MANVASSFINRYHTGEISETWQQLRVTDNATLSEVNIKEILQESAETLHIIDRIRLLTSPSGCREYSPCTIQPVIVAYDPFNQIIDRLGSAERPWQIKATLVSSSTMNLAGGITDYTNGKAEFTRLSLPHVGSYQLRFSFVPPEAVSR